MNVPKIRTYLTLGIAAGLMLSGGAKVSAQQMNSAPSVNPNGNPNIINAATDVNLEQKLDAAVTLSNTFRDESGKTVELSRYFGKKPVVLVMPFYKCPGTCTAMLDGMVKAFADPKIKFKIGRDFEAITVSINPKEDAELASAKKKEYLNLMGIPGAENGWHFLTGDEAHIRKLADEVGYKYKYNAKTDDYAHPAGIILITPQGKVSRYFYGVSYPAGQMKLALTDAGKGKVGSPVDKLILYCYHYDPQTGKYGPAIFRLMQVAGFSTIFILGSFMLIAFRKDARDARQTGTVAAAGHSVEGDR